MGFRAFPGKLSRDRMKIQFNKHSFSSSIGTDKLWISSKPVTSYADPPIVYMRLIIP